IDAPLFCDPMFTMTVTQATSTSDFHRFTFLATDETTTGLRCDIGATQKIFRQCAGQPCDGSGGGGGVKPPNPCLNSATTNPTTNLAIAPGCSPIIIDTEAEGFVLTSADDGVMFDISGNGHPVRIAWTART